MIWGIDWTGIMKMMWIVSPDLSTIFYQSKEPNNLNITMHICWTNLSSLFSTISMSSLVPSPDIDGKPSKVSGTKMNNTHQELTSTDCNYKPKEEPYNFNKMKIKVNKHCWTDILKQQSKTMSIYLWKIPICTWLKIEFYVLVSMLLDIIYNTFLMCNPMWILLPPWLSYWVSGGDGSMDLGLPSTMSSNIEMRQVAAHFCFNCITTNLYKDCNGSALLSSTLQWTSLLSHS